MATFIEFVPLIIFFGVYQWQGILPAVIAIMIAQPLMLGILKLMNKQLTKTQLWTCAAVLAFGLITILLKDPIYIKVKTTVIYAGVGIALATALLLKKNPAKAAFGKLMEEQQIPDTKWKMIAWQWVALMLTLAGANLYAAFFLAEATWVNLKVFVFPILIPVVIFAQFATLFAKADVKDK